MLTTEVTNPPAEAVPPPSSDSEFCGTEVVEDVRRVQPMRMVRSLQPSNFGHCHCFSEPHLSPVLASPSFFAVLENIVFFQGHLDVVAAMCSNFLKLLASAHRWWTESSLLRRATRSRWALIVPSHSGSCLFTVFNLAVWHLCALSFTLSGVLAGARPSFFCFQR